MADAFIMQKELTKNIHNKKTTHYVLSLMDLHASVVCKNAIKIKREPAKL